MAHNWIVLTTINPPTVAIEHFSRLVPHGWSVVVVGDRKTPADWHAPGITYLDVEAQRHRFGRLADAIPYGHYCRKNLGYLYAIQQGAELILETDDDNIPYPSFGKQLQRTVVGRMVQGPGWINVYSHFAPSSRTWPRGLPLDAIDTVGAIQESHHAAHCPIQQYLVDRDPDVDAIFRLVHPGSVFFQQLPALVLAPGAWCPFNSQNTLFFSEVFALLYLPCHVSFRMTDILRSFVAQVCLRRLGQALAFHAPTAEQVRNPHNLMRDFADEVVGYLRNREIMDELERALEQTDCQDLWTLSQQLWSVLHRLGIIPQEELSLHRFWLEGLAEALAARRTRERLSA